MTIPGRFSRGRQYRRKTLVEQFWPKVARAGDAECWLWTGATINSGYGCLRHQGKTITAHLASWLLAGNPKPLPGFCLCHTCDVRLCVNPSHLFLGTLSDNMRDAVSKRRLVQQYAPERMPRGSRHHQAKLTEEQVVEIRALARDGASQRELGRRFGVSGTMIRYIVKGQFWKDVEEVSNAV